MSGTNQDPEELVSASMLTFREKRKWQITFRRYVLEQQACPAYAPYFGLDIQHLRNWFERQFTGEISWENFGKKWQFEHIVPVAYFDFSDAHELKLCWNFTNIRVKEITGDRKRNAHVDQVFAGKYFRELYATTQYEPCLQLLQKIEQLSASASPQIAAQQSFILDNSNYLNSISHYSQYEYELLNMGKSIEEIQQEAEIISRMGM